MTDIILLIDYYNVYKKKDICKVGGIYLFSGVFFIGNLVFLITYRVASSVGLYLDFGLKGRAVLQFLFDTEIFRCIYLNYVFDNLRSGNAQRYIQTYEAVFESTPCLIFASLFLVGQNETSTSNIGSTFTVIASLVLSITSITLKVISEDRLTASNKAKSIDMKCKGLYCRQKKCINWWYLKRVLWRKMDVLAAFYSVFIPFFAFGWVFTVVTFITELIGISIVAFVTKKYELLLEFNIISITGVTGNKNAFKWIVGLLHYRHIIRGMIMIAVIIFLSTDFMNLCPLCGSHYSERRDFMIQDKGVLHIFIFGSLFILVLPPYTHYLLTHGVFVNKVKSRSFNKMLAVNDWNNILETEFFKMNYFYNDNYNKILPNNETLLMIAAKQDTIDRSKRLIKYLIHVKNVDINYKNSDGITCLMIACQMSHFEIIEYLVKNGATYYETTQFNNKQQNVFHYICQNPYPIASGLIDNKIFDVITLERININQKDNTGKTPLMYLCQNSKNIDLIKYFIQNNADVTLTDNDDKTALDYYKESIQEMKETQKKNNETGEDEIELQITRKFREIKPVSMKTYKDVLTKTLNNDVIMDNNDIGKDTDINIIFSNYDSIVDLLTQSN